MNIKIIFFIRLFLLLLDFNNFPQNYFLQLSFLYILFDIITSFSNENYTEFVMMVIELG